MRAAIKEKGRALSYKQKTGVAAVAAWATYWGSSVIASATEPYKVEYKTLVGGAETNFGEAVTAVLVLLGLIIGTLLGIRVVKRLAK